MYFFTYRVVKVISLYDFFLTTKIVYSFLTYLILFYDANFISAFLNRIFWDNK